MYDFRINDTYNSIRFDQAEFGDNDVIVSIPEAKDGTTVRIPTGLAVEVARGLLQEAGVDAWVVERGELFRPTDISTTIDGKVRFNCSHLDHPDDVTPDEARLFARQVWAAADEAERQGARLVRRTDRA